MNLYLALGEGAQNFLPQHVTNGLRAFMDLCYTEPYDPTRQQAEIDRQVLELKAMIPSYVDVGLMLFPHEDSRAFQYKTEKQEFETRLRGFIDREAIDESVKNNVRNILNMHDFSIGIPPVTQEHMDLMYSLVIGDKVSHLRDFREILGLTNDTEEVRWNYFMDVLEQMVVQSSHYTTNAEKQDFLDRAAMSVGFEGLNGFIRTLVSGSADTAIGLITGEMFNAESCRITEYTDAETLFNTVKSSGKDIVIVKIKTFRQNIFRDKKWFPYLSRMIFVDASDLSVSTNTSLVFAFHNMVISTLDKVHTKVLGAPANAQMNMRLLLGRLGQADLENFRQALQAGIDEYEKELKALKLEQLGTDHDYHRDITLYKFNEFARQIIKDKYAVQKLHDYIVLLQKAYIPKNLKKLNAELIREFEDRIRAYVYSNIDQVRIATVVEGGGRGQLRTYGEFLLQRKPLGIDPKIVRQCRAIIDIIPNNYQRTLKNHFHKNFGLNLFLEKYKEYITKVENEADSTGRFKNLLIDLDIREAYEGKTKTEQRVIRDFLSNLGNLEITSIADDVQMIIRDILSSPVLQPYILFNTDASWEYKDIFPVDRFDINPFDLEIGLTKDKRIDFERLHRRLNRMKNTFQLFDDTGSLWDRFCENLTIIINDPSNPAGYTDFNNQELLKFLKFLNNNRITLLLDEAYNDAIKLDNTEEPKWRTISRYVMNNIGSMASISVVSSLSTTKNLGATGSRLGALVATPARQDVIEFAKQQNPLEKANTNALYMLVNVLENAQLAKKIKDKMEMELSKEASRNKIRTRIEKYMVDEVDSYLTKRGTLKQGRYIPRFSPFEGSPLHIFLLEELADLNKLDVLGLPDDFKYKGEPFFKYYREHLVRQINKFRVNKNFRSESNKRLQMAKDVATEVLEQIEGDYADVLPSDGSYLFNLQMKNFFSYQDLEAFTHRLAAECGIAVIPYATGFLRFAMGGYLKGDAQSYKVFQEELRTSLNIVLKYWDRFYKEKNRHENMERPSVELLDRIFGTHSGHEFIQRVLEDFKPIGSMQKYTPDNLCISNSSTVYQPYPDDSGVSINSIKGSENAVIEFYETIGKCRDLSEFIRSKAFTKVYETLLPKVYQKVPLLRDLAFQTVLNRYNKAILLKYIENKLGFQPNSYVLDNPDERLIMSEILLEMENLLFSDSQTKLMAINTSDDVSGDKARLEGINRILRKYIQELLLHFNLPFEQEPGEPSLVEIFDAMSKHFVEITGIAIDELELDTYVSDFFDKKMSGILDSTFGDRLGAVLHDAVFRNVMNNGLDSTQKLMAIYLLKKDDALLKKIKSKMDLWKPALTMEEDREGRLYATEFIQRIASREIDELIAFILDTRNNRINRDKLHAVVRDTALFYILMANHTRATEYYDRYVHILIRFTEIEFKGQNSRRNEMIQHGITVYTGFNMDKSVLSALRGSGLEWISKLMAKTGVIVAEQPVQIHTRIVTDAKKREYPFHKVDRSDNFDGDRDFDKPNEYIKHLDTKPDSVFFSNRLARFVDKMDANDYVCMLRTQSLVKVLFVFHKYYTKYLPDMFRLLRPEDTEPDDIRKFMPDVMIIFGAPQKVISFPQISFFDLKGPRGNIKTIITPLRKDVDYFGNIKKPWLTMLNEKVKEMGGIPVHGSLFAVEAEDGHIFVVQVDGDSGVGKSEMLAAMIMKWLRNDLSGIRSIKMIAGDMFFVFSGRDGNLYGIGTEEGDFSRVTDFDPDFIRYYNSLFGKAADSNVNDLNSRSTISGLCDITMPYKIDIMLTASNFGREEAGIIRYENPENFLLYRDSHGERKEKATSSDNPNFQRTLLRYTADKSIVEVMDKHGNYIDDVLAWDLDQLTGEYFLASSYRHLDKIDIEDVVNKIFINKVFSVDEDRDVRIESVSFDIIKNRFVANVRNVNTDEQQEYVLTRRIFGEIFDSLASTPSGQPFVAEEGQYRIRKDLIRLLKNNQAVSTKGKGIQLGILSTDLGRKGKEISGPRLAADDLKKMMQELRIARPGINMSKKLVQDLLTEKYKHIFGGTVNNSELLRYNYFIYQMEIMRKARFVRIDNPDQEVDLSGIRDFQPVSADKEFSPLLITPDINMELISFNETCDQLMGLPGLKECADEFVRFKDQLYAADGYSNETIVNNMILQLLLLSGYIKPDDIFRKSIITKVTREILAAAKYALKQVFPRFFTSA